MDVKYLAKRFRENINGIHYDSNDQNFINSMIAISEFSTVEQTLIRKDNNRNINKNKVSSESRGHDYNTMK